MLVQTGNTYQYITHPNGDNQHLDHAREYKHVVVQQSHSDAQSVQLLALSDKLTFQACPYYLFRHLVHTVLKMKGIIP